MRDPNELYECDDEPEYRENIAADSGDEWSKADPIDFYSRYGMEEVES